MEARTVSTDTGFPLNNTNPTTIHNRNTATYDIQKAAAWTIAWGHVCPARRAHQSIDCATKGRAVPQLARKAVASASSTPMLAARHRGTERGIPFNLFANCEVSRSHLNADRKDAVRNGRASNFMW